MALPTNPSTWMQEHGFPSRVFGVGRDDYELYEEDGEFVLAIELPGFDPAEIDLNWYDGRLNVAAEHDDDRMGRRRTYHRTFRFPKEVDEDAISASYENGVLEVALPVETAASRGTTIDVEG